MEKPVAQAPEKAASEEKLLDDKELELERERKLKKEQKAREKEEKKLKAKQKEAARLQAQATSDGPKKSEKKQKKKAADDENPEDFIDPETPSGQKKSLAPQMAKQYSPSTVEKSWYAWWESAGYFGADPASSKPPFVIVLPPPNVTGALHIGHALTVAIEDAMIRWRRMSGYNALWVPGVDHAGIATQVVVEKKLMRERKLTRHDIGRDKFISEVLKWKDQYGGTILGQLRRLGASLDWSRECFTMDDQRSKAVTEAFVRLHKDGLVYRDYRLVNWDCTLLTAISDIEVDHLELKEETMLKVPGYSSPVQFGVLISFAYPLEEGLGEIIVATTRIETMLGDTAIAVHPEDKRYKHLHGKHAIHPFNGRKLKIICDAVLVDPTFGTGAVKITPAHDPNDFEVGKRHNLEFINIFTDDGKINSNGGAQFEGMPRFAARVAVIDALKEKGLYKDTKKNEMNLGICSRSNDVVEPMIKPQWFVNCHTMAKAGLDAVRSKKIEIIPQQYEQDWYRWLENIRDWCVSRQLWWGHRVPAWYVTLEDEQLSDLGSNNDRWIVARNECDAMLEAQKKYPGKKFQLNQDPDVLDTWFSSGLFPLTVLGWPDDTADLRAFYPTSVLETGLDILFFWVARMVMMGMQLGGDVPFQKVYLHPMIRDAHGRKMSKSLGNVVDPLEVINGTTLEDLLKRLEEGNLDQNELSVAREGKKKDFPDGIAECGTDALRFALISYTSQSDKINLDIKRVVGYRQWCNKLWNAIRFAMGKLGDHYTPPATIVVSSMPPVCKWILSVLNKAIGKTVTSLEAYKFADATSAIYSWWQYQLCDVFIEAVKPYFFNDSHEFDSARAACRDALWVCLDNGLRLLHPFMPYVTEELWQRLPQPKDSCRKNSIMISEYPSIVKEWADDKLESEIGIILDTVNKLRSLKPTTDTNERRPAFALCRGEDIAATVQCYQSLVVSLSSVSSLKILAESDETPPDCSTAVVNKDLSVYLQLQGALNAEVELEKLRKKRDEIQKLQHALSQKMEASGYREKAPPSVQEEDMRKLTAFFEQLRVIGEAEKKLDA
ncbi:Valyl-tRNA synthetase [Hordeum vulgare]|uniref:Valine--tRNA ligase, mitochondrial n=1 Tax=Hordeum vulgare subsp. vulgare TaxID=112509 RepID=A0A8I6WPZ6_HORVV|nr:valine--tRNA ligase, mitochondrial 1-like isoform X2 [Hordeum vulgare subsp. vulgare]KAE8783792.1 Valyl-tRNA synthetase [Hordeum vulgare]